MPEVLVLGAGVAGLTVAWRLAKAGREVQIAEARDRVGGRLASVELGGHRFDLGATWVWEHETAIAKLLQELGIATFPSREDGDDLVEEPTQLLRGRMPTSWSAEHRVAGGTAAIAHALYERTEAQVTTGQVATAISPVEGGLRVDFADGKSVEAEHVVAALPPPLVAPLVAEAAPDVAKRLARVPIWMGDIAKVVAVYEQPIWRDRGLSGRAFSRRGPLVEIHDLSGPSDDDGVALFGFSPRTVVDGFDDTTLGDAVRAQLARIFGAPPTHVHVEAWWRSPFTVPAELAPPDESLFGDASLRRPILERLHLGSTETAAQSTGHIDGSVRRAEELAAQLAG